MADTNTETAPVLNTFTWGTKGSPDYCETDITVVPTANLANLALQGYRHKLGNEVAAKVAAHKKTDEGKVKTDDEIAQYAREARAEMLDKIVNGVLGVRASSGAPRVTGTEAIRRTVTVESLRKLLKKSNLAMPTGEDTVFIAGKAMTREDLIAAMYRKDQKAIDAEVARREAHEIGGDLDSLAS